MLSTIRRRGVAAFIVLALVAITSRGEDYICRMTFPIGGGHSKQWTGVAVSDRLILSVAHAIQSGEAECKFGDKVVKAEVIKFDTVRDLALFRCKEPHGVAPLALSDTKPKVCRIAGWFGNVFKRLEYRVNGMVVWVEPLKDEKLTAMDGEAFHGMSGSPVIGEDGKLVGIQCSGTKEMTVAARLKQVKAFLKGVE